MTGSSSCRLLLVGSKPAPAIESLPDVEVVAEAEAAQAALRIAADRPDVVLVDAEADALGVLRDTRGKGVPVIVVALRDEPALLVEFMQAGAAGVIRREAPARAFADAIQVVRAGGSYVDPEKVLGMAALLEASRAGGASRSPALTKRESEVLRFLADGLSARQIATRLSLSERTVNTHVATLYRKLGVSNRVEAVREGMRLGLVPPPG